MLRSKNAESDQLSKLEEEAPFLQWGKDQEVNSHIFPPQNELTFEHFA